VSDPTRARLRALLGSGEPELTCEECFAELDGYVELEFTGAPAEALLPAMRAHLEGCGACAEEHASLLDLVRGEAPPGPPPPLEGPP
jgi:hypothetical protein